MRHYLFFLLIALPSIWFGCGYDYGALAAHHPEAGTTPLTTPGSGGAAGGSGGAKDAGGPDTPQGSGGHIDTRTDRSGDTGGGDVVDAGGKGSGGQDSGSGGRIGPGPVSGGNTGGGGNRGGGGGGGERREATGGMGNAGRGGTGGKGTAGEGTGGTDGGVMAMPRILSIDLIGGYTLTLSTGGAGGGAGAAGGKGGAAAGGTAGAAGAVYVPLPAMAPSEIAGFKPASHWNGASGPSGSLGGLVLADGSVTSATVTWSAPPSGTGVGVWRLGLVDAPGDARMMNGYLDPLTPTLPASLIVSGLPTTITSGGYDVYVYVAGNVPSGVRTYRYTIGTSIFTVSQTGPSPTTFTGYALAPAGGAGNYIVFRKLTDASFTLTATPGTGSLTRAPVNGIQIISPSGS